jgi:septal ring factor EnvC (AmiA/AmiB activator)
MKTLFIAMLLVSFVYSDEMARIESIVQDITKLRTQYEECKSTLKGMETLKADVVKTDNCKELKSKYASLDKSCLNSEKLLQKYKKLLKIKDNEIENLKKKLKLLSKKRVSAKQKSDNVFPKLMPKERNSQAKKEVQEEEIIVTKASTYRLKNDSSIYAFINNKVIDLWEKNTSFTSNKRSNNWIKITGYFVNQKWMKAKKDMWIKDSDVYKR